METPLPVSNNPREGKQGRRLYYRLKTSIHKTGMSIAELQPALEYPGTDMEDEFAAILVKYSKKVRGIVTPVRAQDTGLIPEGCIVEKDDLEGDVNLAKVDYSYCPVQTGEQWVNGPTMFKRAAEKHAVGSLGYAAHLLKAQKEGKEIFPVESRGKEYFIMPRTVLLDRYGNRHVASFYWFGKASEWVLLFFWADTGGAFGSDDRFLRPRE